MTSDPAMSLRVARLENDTHSLYEMVGEVQTTLADHTRRLDGIDTRLDGIDGRLDGIDTRLDHMDGRFDSVDTVLAEILRRLPEPS
ncbi:hypothetical protein ACLM5J_15990 [Nocardioides sp. Bht2]|uniref:hypothetical protein n=1 Tax=Nocardioides sp. Bht2 TaxID=3392297 RepID=UPI0039B37500